MARTMQTAKRVLPKLHRAAKEGDVEAVRQQLEDTDADVNQINEANKTALCAAAANGHEHVVELLLAHGAYVGTGQNPLVAAGRQGHLGVVQQLLDAGADVRKPGWGGETPLHAAAYSGHTKIVAKLLQAGVDVQAVDNQNMTALHSACSSDWSCSEHKHDLIEGPLQNSMVRLLLDAGAVVDAADQRGRTALHYAAATGATEAIDELLAAATDARAFLSDRDIGGATALHVAVQQGQSAAAAALVAAHAPLEAADNEGRTPLICAAVDAQSLQADIQMLLAAGADPTAADKNGRTALHHAAAQGMTEVVHALLAAATDARASLAARDLRHSCGWSWHRGGATALHLAVEQGHGAVAAALVAAAAPLEVVDREGRTPLILAVLHAQPRQADTVRMLLAAGADPTATDSRGMTALHHAASQEMDCDDRDDGRGLDELLRTSVTAALLAATGYSATADKQGRTPLDIAVACGQHNVIGQLFQAWDAAGLVDSKGMSALHRAAAEGYADVVHQLIATAADVDKADNSGKTALHHAAMNGWAEIVECLLAAGANANAADAEGCSVLLSAALEFGGMTKEQFGGVRGQCAGVLQQLSAAGGVVSAVAGGSSTGAAAEDNSAVRSAIIAGLKGAARNGDKETVQVLLQHRALQTADVVLVQRVTKHPVTRKLLRLAAEARSVPVNDTDSGPPDGSRETAAAAAAGADTSAAEAEAGAGAGDMVLTAERAGAAMSPSAPSEAPATADLSVGLNSRSTAAAGSQDQQQASVAAAQQQQQRQQQEWLVHAGEMQLQRQQQQEPQPADPLPTSGAHDAAAPAAATEPVVKQESQDISPDAYAPSAGPAALALLHDANTAGFLPPSESEVRYFLLADSVFDGGELLQLHGDKLVGSFVGTRAVASVQRSGAVRESQVSVKVDKSKVEQGYPLLAPRLLKLRDAVPQLKGGELPPPVPQQQQPGSRRSKKQKQGELDAAAAAAVAATEAAAAAGVVETTDTLRLLLALRCLREWEARPGSKLPMLLQLLLFGKPQQSEVAEVVDLAAADDDEQLQQQLMSMDGDEGVVMTKVVAPKQSSRKRKADSSGGSVEEDGSGLEEGIKAAKRVKQEPGV